MAGQLVKQLEDVSLDIDDWNMLVDAILLVTRNQEVKIELSLIDARTFFEGGSPVNSDLSVKIVVKGPGIDTENNAAQTAPSGALVNQLFHPAGATATMTLAPGHYVVTAHVKRLNTSAKTLKLRRAYLAIRST